MADIALCIGVRVLFVRGNIMRIVINRNKNLLTKVKYFLAGFLNYLTNLFLGMTKRLALCSSLYELADFMFY